MNVEVGIAVALLVIGAVHIPLSSVSELLLKSANCAPKFCRLLPVPWKSTQTLVVPGETIALVCHGAGPEMPVVVMGVPTVFVGPPGLE